MNFSQFKQNRWGCLSALLVVAFNQLPSTCNAAQLSTDQRIGLLAGTCSNSFGQYPSKQVSKWCAVADGLLRDNVSGINLTSYYGVRDYNGSGTYHNGIDFQSKDIAADCTSVICPDYNVYAPFDATVVHIDPNYGAVQLESVRDENGTNVRFRWAVLHMKVGSFDRLKVGSYVPLGGQLGTQWSTGALGSEHVHLEFANPSYTGLLSGRVPDANALNPALYLDSMVTNLGKISSDKLSLMNVKRVNISSGSSYIGQTITFRAEGTKFPPSAMVRVFRKGTLDESIADCVSTPIVRGTVGNMTYFEQQCKLLDLGAYEIKVYPAWGRPAVYTSFSSVLPVAQVLGQWGQLEGKPFEVALTGADLPKLRTVQVAGVDCQYVTSSSTSQYYLYKCPTPQVTSGDTFVGDVNVIGKTAAYSFNIYGGVLGWDTAYWVNYFGYFYSAGFDTYRYVPAVGEQIRIKVNFAAISGNQWDVPASAYFSSITLAGGDKGDYRCAPIGADYTFICPLLPKGQYTARVLMENDRRYMEGQYVIGVY